MELFDLLRAVCDELQANQVPHALTGSVASSIYGEPRASLDADVVVQMTPEVARKVAQHLARRFYVSEEALVDAAEQGTMANVIDGATGYKLDLSVLKQDRYHSEVFRRRRQLSMPGDPGDSIWVCSPEDIVLMKMVWRKESRSEKQFADALNVVRGQRNQLDWTYIRRWGRELGIESDIEELNRAADE